MSNNNSIIENVKVEVNKDIIEYIYDNLLPDGKIPIYYSPLNSTNDEYITWKDYSSTGPYKDKDDNYCRPNEIGTYQTPTEDTLLECNDFFNTNTQNLMSIDNFILNQIDNITDITQPLANAATSNTFDETEFNNKKQEYADIKLELAKNRKLLDNIKNIEKIINNINNKVKKDEQEKINIVNINNTNIKNEKWNYLSKRNYVTTIILLISIIIIISFIKQ